MDKEQIEALIIARIQQIDGLKEKLEQYTLAVQSALYDSIIREYDNILSNYIQFYTVYSQFVTRNWMPFIQELINTFDSINTWNKDYFKAQQVERLEEVSTIVTQKLYEAYGLQSNGQVIQGGYIDSLLTHPGIKNQVGQYLHSEVIKPRAKPVALRELESLVKGSGNNIGVVQAFNNQFVYDRLQEADRITHSVYADELNLTAKLYIGALREGSRPFCIARAGKCFIDSEIKQFGTPSDKYGGYEDKSTGYFKGKPTAYNPFMNMGGYRCVHAWGAVTNRTALRLRSDLTEVNGALVIE